ncbi:unnamed protein product [Lampetra fluviatilis]
MNVAAEVMKVAAMMVKLGRRRRAQNRRWRYRGTRPQSLRGIAPKPKGFDCCSHSRCLSPWPGSPAASRAVPGSNIPSLSGAVSSFLPRV